jgi:serine/threonine-protein kinase
MSEQSEPEAASHTLPNTCPDLPPTGPHFPRPDEPPGGPCAGPDSSGAQPATSGLTLPDAADPAPSSWSGDGERRTISPTRPSSGGEAGESRYQIFGEIGRGGMGAVLRAHDPDLGRDLALKVLLEQHQDGADLVQRFIEEAQVGGQLQHPGIVPVYELGRFSDRRPYFAMKLVQGCTLASLLAERREASQDLPRFLKIFEQVCQTVAYAHSRGIIHRDLKPQNIMVGAFGEVQVMDWGLAKVLNRPVPPDAPTGRDGVRTVRSEQPEAQSRTGHVLGTPAYMAPEQARGEINRLDERTDVFGLGAILCEILTGQPPYLGKDGIEVYDRARWGDLADALARLENCSTDTDLLQLAQRCLAADPGDRPRDAGMVAEAVTAHLASTQERLQAAELERAAAQAREEEARAKMAAERRARRLTVTLAVSVVAIVLLAGGGWAWYEQDREGRRAETARSVHAALREAILLRGQARWTEALAAARRAEAVLANGEGEDELERQVQGLVTTLAAEERRAKARADRQRQDRAMAALLENIRLEQAAAHGGDRGVTRADTAYGAAFRGYGIDVDRLGPAEAAARIRRRAIRAELTAALDGWALARLGLAGGQDGAWQRLLAVGQRADFDPVRQRLRAALARRDPRAVKTLAAELDVKAAKATTLDFLALALSQAAGPAEAVAFLRRAQWHHPGDFWLNNRLANLLAELGPAHRDEALRFCTAALAIRPDSPGAYLNLGAALVALGDLDQAINALTRALQLDPGSAAVHANLGSAWQKKGQLERAVRAYREAIRLQPTLVQAHVNLGNALLEQGKVREALRAAQQTVNLAPLVADAHLNLGVALVRTGDLNGAIAAFEKAVRLRPRDPRVHLNLGGALAEKGELDRAVRVLRQAINLDPNLPEAHLNLGTALGKQGRQDDAIAALQAAIRLRPDLADAYFNLGSAQRQKGNWKEAAAAFRQVIRLKPRDAAAHYYLGIVLLKQEGAAKEAAATLREAVRLDPSSAAANRDLGLALHRTGALDEAIAAYDRAIRLEPRDALAHYNRGLALDARGEPEQALAAYRQAIRLVPKWAAAHINLGLALIDKGVRDRDRGLLEQAVAALREAVRLAPANARGHYNLGFALATQGHLADAVAPLRQAIRCQPDYTQAHLLLGQVLQQQGKFQEALPALQRGHDLGSRDPRWPHPSAQWVRDCRRLVELDRQLPALLSGKAQPAGAAEKLELARLCILKHLYAAAARWSAEAFTEKAALAEELSSQQRYNAACAAALAGSGRGKDAAQTDAPERARLRRQAVAWLRADLALWGRQLDQGTRQARDLVRRTLVHWQSDLDLAGIRADVSLAKLPEAEQQACRKLWADVEALRQRARK